MSQWNKTATGQPTYTLKDPSIQQKDVVPVEGGWAHVVEYTDADGDVRRKEEILVAMKGAGDGGLASEQVGATLQAVYFVGDLTPSTSTNPSVAQIRAVFSEAVDVTGTPQIVAVNGNQSGNAAGNQTFDYVSGSGTNELVFELDVFASTLGDTDVLTLTATTSNINLNGGTANDAIGTASAVTDLTVAAAELGTQDTITISA